MIATNLLSRRGSCEQLEKLKLKSNMTPTEVKEKIPLSQAILDMLEDYDKAEESLNEIVNLIQY